MKILKGYNGRPILVKESDMHKYVSTTYGWLRRDKKYTVVIEDPNRVGTLRLRKTGQQIYDDMVKAYEYNIVANSPEARAARGKKLEESLGSLDNPDWDKIDFVGKEKLIKTGKYESFKKQARQNYENYARSQR